MDFEKSKKWLFPNKEFEERTYKDYVWDTSFESTGERKKQYYLRFSILWESRAWNFISKKKFIGFYLHCLQVQQNPGFLAVANELHSLPK